jgi:transposase
MECEPGEEAQVDFGSGAPVVDREGRRRKTHIFRIVLSHSRKGYSEAVFRQTIEEFIRCLENSFHHFGGSVKTLVIDNLRAAVTKADWYEPELHPKLRWFCEHYGVVARPPKHHAVQNEEARPLRDDPKRRHPSGNIQDRQPHAKQDCQDCQDLHDREKAADIRGKK